MKGHSQRHASLRWGESGIYCHKNVCSGKDRYSEKALETGVKKTEPSDSGVLFHRPYNKMKMTPDLPTE